MSSPKQRLIESLQEIKNLRSFEKKTILGILGILFLILFSYPIIRSVADATFIEHYGAKNSPIIWVASVLVLTLVVSLYSQLQIRMNVKWLFGATAIFSFIFIELCFWEVMWGNYIWAFPFYIWKECYIVLMFHLAFGYLNSMISKKTAQLLYGPLGAMISLGGIAGGAITAQWTQDLGMKAVLLIGTFTLVICACIFALIPSPDRESQGSLDEEMVTPLSAVRDVKKYVFIIVLIVMLTQFCISIANLNFYIALEKNFLDQIERTSFLGQVYSLINVVSFCIQFFIVPWALSRFSLFQVHLFIPLFDMIICVFSFFIFGSFVYPVATAFALLKGIDYSIFAVSKELLYFPLTRMQRFGAKYLVDIVGYRLGKGLISTFLIFVQGSVILNFLLLIFLGFWMGLLVPLFKDKKQKAD